MIEFKCGQCGAEMEAPQSQAGGVERCPRCGSPNRVPKPARPAAVAPESLAELSQAAPTVPHAGPLSNGPAARPARNRKRVLILAAIAGVVAVAAVGGFLAGHIGRSNPLQSKSVAGDQAPPPPAAPANSGSSPSGDETSRKLAQLQAEIERLKAAAVTPSPAAVDTAPTPSATPVKIPDSARKALARLKRLQAKVEAGLNFSDYSKEFADTWADVKPYLDSQDSTINPGLSATIALSCTYYKAANDAWSRVIAPQDSDIEATETGYDLERHKLIRSHKNEMIRLYSWKMGDYAIALAEAEIAGDVSKAATAKTLIDQVKKALERLDKDKDYGQQLLVEPLERQH